MSGNAPFDCVPSYIILSFDQRMKDFGVLTVSDSPVVSAPPALPQVKLCAVADAARWDAYVKATPAATFCHLTGWRNVIARTWGHKDHSLYAERHGRIVGVLPLMHVKSPLFGSMLISTPNAVYGGVIADDAVADRALLETAAQLARELNVDFLELRDTAAANAGFEETAYRDYHLQDQLYVTFDHPITTDEEALLKTFPRDTRRMIRQGPKHNLTATVEGANALNEFYEVYATSVHHLGTPVFPKRLFAEFLREFPNECDILVIRQDGRFAGAVLSFYFRDTVMPYYAGAYAEFYRTGINNFMYSELMRLSAERGYTRFDFGRSKRGTGAYEFKRGWGMSEHVLPYRTLLVRAQSLPNLNPTNPKYKFMIETWKRLPLALTKLIGPPLVKYLP
ncbi:MAG: FemAB family PEP-CTERM system-associated protein [Acidobacteria bacterium]|nr:FemAB family PEP-CTERM system-associated protein [Acidobacteriota bacterium]